LNSTQKDASNEENHLETNHHYAIGSNHPLPHHFAGPDKKTIYHETEVYRIRPATIIGSQDSRRHQSRRPDQGLNKIYLLTWWRGEGH
jgi:hypothetical protein